MAESLKKQAITGVGWSAVERFSVQGVQFILQIILARLLLPSDYGIIAMMAIFLQVAAVFVESGFASALIQKKDCKEEDYSTVFYYNLAVSVGLYIILFFIAPLVARFYQIDLITKVMRVASLVVIFNALSIVQRVKLEKQINFRSISIVSFSSATLSGIIGVLMAYWGFGVWALCFQSLLNSLFQILAYYIFVRWKPALIFSKQSFKELFTFGSKMLFAGIISVIYGNLYTIVIGKRFNSTDLGYYSRAEHFAGFPSSNVGSLISRVTFPVLSKIQDDDDKLREAYRKIIRLSSFVIFPLMSMLSALASPLVISLLGEKWSSAAPLLQILCMALLWDHLSLLNLNLLYVKGKSNLVLRLEIIKKSIAVVILFASIPFGLLVMCWGRVLYGIISFYLNTFYTKRLIGISFWNQVVDFLPFLLISLLTGVLSYFAATIAGGAHWVKLIIGLITGSLVYVAFSVTLFRNMIQEVVGIIRKK